MAPAPKIISLLEDRVCKKCNVAKPMSEYSKRTSNKNYHNGVYYRLECRACEILSAKKSYDARKHTPEYKEKARDRNLKRKYGISLDQAKSILATQMNLCANRGCGVSLTFDAEKGRKNKANVDHCHTTGRLRGILCLTCNTALGLIEQKNRMLGLTEYLDKYTLISRS